MRTAISTSVAIATLVACAPAQQAQSPAVVAATSAPQVENYLLEQQAPDFSKFQFTATNVGFGIGANCQLSKIDTTLPKQFRSSKRSGEIVFIADIDEVDGQQIVIHAVQNNSDKDTTVSWVDPSTGAVILSATFLERGIRKAATRCDVTTTAPNIFALKTKTRVKIGPAEQYEDVSAYVQRPLAAGANVAVTFGVESQLPDGVMEAHWVNVASRDGSVFLSASSPEFAAAINPETLGVSRAQFEQALRRADMTAEFKLQKDFADPQLLVPDFNKAFSVVPDIDATIQIPGAAFSKPDSIFLLGPDKRALATGSLPALSKAEQ